jgi:hypothetical protein
MLSILFSQVSGGFFTQQQPVVAAAATPVNIDVDGDVGAIAGRPVGTIEYVVSLSDRPQNPYVLWEEYEFSLNVQKPQKASAKRQRTSKIQRHLEKNFLN